MEMVALTFAAAPARQPHEAPLAVQQHPLHIHPAVQGFPYEEVRVDPRLVSGWRKDDWAAR